MKYLVVIDEAKGRSPHSAERGHPDDEQHAINEVHRAITEIPGVSPAVQLESARTATPANVLFEADGFDAAIELASRLPIARMGGAVEVRPIVGLNGSPIHAPRTSSGERSHIHDA